MVRPLKGSSAASGSKQQQQQVARKLDESTVEAFDTAFKAATATASPNSNNINHNDKYNYNHNNQQHHHHHLEADLESNEICLFSSSEELLDSKPSRDFHNNFHQQKYHPQTSSFSLHEEDEDGEEARRGNINKQQQHHQHNNNQQHHYHYYYHNNNFDNDKQLEDYTNLQSSAPRLSIDSREGKYYAQQQQASYNNNNNNKSSLYHHHNNSYSFSGASSSNKQSCLRPLSRCFKSLFCCFSPQSSTSLSKEKRAWPPVRSPAAACRLLKMALKRYYLTILFLILVILVCLLATVVISRSVGTGLGVGGIGGDENEKLQQDEGRTASALKQQDQQQQAKAPTPPPEELEVRAFDLIDLVECGKTFAYTKLRIQVRVPKSSPTFHQQPAFLHHNNPLQPQQQQNNAGDVINQSGPTMVAPPGGSGFNLDAEASSNQQEEEQQASSEPKFILTSLKEVDPHLSGANLLPETTETSVDVVGLLEEPTTQLSITNNLAGSSSLNTVQKKELAKQEEAMMLDPLLDKIKPVVPANQEDAAASSSSAQQKSLAAQAPELATLLAGGAGAQAVVAGAEPRELLVEELGSESELEEQLRSDPIQLAASDMHLSLSAINRTVIDCFLIDTEKRFAQRVALEDKYRQVASTRKVGLKKMMSIILDCRLLTWQTVVQQQLMQLDHSSSSSSSTQASSHMQQVGGASDQNDALIAAASSSSSSSMDELELPSVLNPVTTPAPASNMEMLSSFLGGWLSAAAGNRWQSSSPPTPSSSLSSDQDQLLTMSASSNNRQQLVPTTNDKEQQEQKRHASYLNMAISMVSGIVPNTLWCGLGDRAQNYSELGQEFRVDSCCRSHDHCPIRLKPFTTDYGLVNWSMSTKSHCECDIDFGDCLTAVNSTLSSVIKTIYFRFVGLQCIDVEAPAIRQNQASLGSNSQTSSSSTNTLNIR